jgi:hypothetical protein
VHAQQVEAGEEAPEAEEQIDYAKRLGLPGVALALAIGSFAGLAAPPLLISGTLILAAVPSFKRAWAGIRDEKKLNVDFLDSTAIALLTTTGARIPVRTIEASVNGSGATTVCSTWPTQPNLLSDVQDMSMM